MPVFLAPGRAKTISLKSSIERSPAQYRTISFRDPGLNERLDKALTEQLTTQCPTDVLLIAPQVSPGLKNYLSDRPQTQLTHIDFRSLEQSVVSLGRFELAIVADTLDKLDKESAELLIARLRDLHAKLLWVEVPENQLDCYSSDDAIAQGMRMVSPGGFGSREPQWYEFSLQFYKPVPQWLNAAHWANPDQWDKSRW